MLVCSEDNRNEFIEELSNEAREALVGWAQAEAHASPAELLDAVAPVLERAQAKDERETLDRWREEAGRNGRGSSGWASTLEAASDGRVELLLFQEGADRDAYRCPVCGRATLEEGSCPLDGTRLEHVDAGLDLAVHQTLAHGGAVWAIRHHDDLVLEAQEGRLFKPLAFTKNFSMAIAAVLAVTLAPAMLSLLMQLEPYRFRPKWLCRIANAVLV